MYIEASLPKRQNVPLYDVIMWLNNTSEDDQCLLLHHCLFGSAHRFIHVEFMREANTQVYTEPNDKDGSKYNKMLCSAKLGKKGLCIAFLLILTLRKSEWSSRQRQNLILCSLYFTAYSFTNRAQCDAGFSEKLKLKEDAVPSILAPAVMSQHKSNCFITWSGHYCFVC